jgi:hypothetical protein
MGAESRGAEIPPNFCSFIQTLTVGLGITPSQPTTGGGRVADFTAGSDLHRPPEQCGAILPQLGPRHAM